MQAAAYSEREMNMHEATENFNHFPRRQR